MVKMILTSDEIIKLPAGIIFRENDLATPLLVSCGPTTDGRDLMVEPLDSDLGDNGPRKLGLSDMDRTQYNSRQWWVCLPDELGNMHMKVKKSLKRVISLRDAYPHRFPRINNYTNGPVD